MMTKEERIEKAKALFKEGYNCSQSVVAAYADLYGFTPDQSFLMSAAFGAGIGRMRETCGAACGMFLLAGLERGAVDGKDRARKSATYALVQELAAQFKKEFGTIRCADLLGLNKDQPISPNAESRTKEYYAKRPCIHMVETAARFFGDYLEKEGKL